MRIRWVLAAAAALALGTIAIRIAPETSWWADADTDIAAAGGSICDSGAGPANLDFTIQDMHGADVALSQYRGSVILLNFWATWCGPCKYEIPAFVELQDQYRDEGLVVLGLSVDDPVAKLKPFAEEFNMNYPVLVGLGRDDVQQAYGPLWGIPVTFMISRDGTLCKRHMGIATKDQFEAMIKELL